MKQILPLYSDKVLHTIYQTFIQQTVVKAALWPRYIDLRVNTHAHMQELAGLSGVRMNHLVLCVYALTPHKRIHTLSTHYSHSTFAHLH